MIAFGTRRVSWADPQVRIVKMLSDVPLDTASREKGSGEES